MNFFVVLYERLFLFYKWSNDSDLTRQINYYLLLSNYLVTLAHSKIAQMKPELFLWILIPLIIFTSCKTILLNKIFRDPVVETTFSIERFQKQQGSNLKYSLIAKGSAATAKMDALQCLSKGYYVFDSSGKQLCYQGTATCSGTQFRELLLEEGEKKFIQCGGNHLDDLLRNAYNLKQEIISFSDLPRSRFYILQYWSKFAGGKRGYQEEVKWMEEEITKESRLSRSFIFLTVNTDLQESWGLLED
jgi:hypothetical protein